MKKILMALSALVLTASVASAQVLSEQQMKNTAWTGFGSPIDGNLMYYGFTDTFQARFDRGSFTIEGMLNWSFLANYDNDGDVDNFVFGTSNLNPLSLKYGTRSGGYRAGDNTVPNSLKAAYDNRANVSNTIQDSYYVNFVWHFLDGFDFGVGTKLNWQVGPAPRYGSWLWEDDAHIRQGGFSTTYDDRAGVRISTSSETAGSYKFHVDRPGTADVVGFVPYANKYAKRALGVRYMAKSKDMSIQLGAALPNGFNTDDPAVNFGAQVGLAKWLSLAAALEGAFDDGSNFYTGATLGTGIFVIDMYFAADSLFTDADDDQAYGTGAAISFTIPKTKINIRPELGVNFFENDNYDFAWYTGGSLSFKINNDLGFSVWGSFAQGSKDKRWDDKDKMGAAAYEITKKWNGGHVFNIRPQISLTVDKHSSFSVYADLEQRTAFDGEERNCWSSGVFWSYVF